MSETLNAETFNLDDWLSDAYLPQDSCKVYKRGDVISELSSLREEIEDQQSVVGKSLADTEKLMDLTERYEKLLTTFGDSAVTVFVQAVPRSTLRAIKASSEEDAKAHKWTPAQANEELGYAIIAQAIIGLQASGQERQQANFSAKDARRLEDKIGSGQFGAIMEARKRADSALEEPDADFLRKSSGTSKDDIAG